MITIDPQLVPQSEIYQYMIAAVAPRPIALASTIDKAGNINLSPFSFFNVFSSVPPIMIFSPVRSGRDNTTKHTYDNIKEVPEVVINIVNHPMVEQMSLASTAYDRGVNEFVKSGFTSLASEKIKPPRVGESPVSFECRVDNVIELGKTGGAGNLVIARVVLIHVQEAYLNEAGKLDTTKLDLVARMGGNWYCRASGNALFEIAKPLRTKGLGVDQLPESIRNSNVLTGNDLGRLGNVETMPNENTIAKILEDQEIHSIILQAEQQADLVQTKLHQLAQQYLQNGQIEKALNILFAADVIL